MAQERTTASASQRATEAQVRERAEALLAEMTVEEKPGQLTQLFYFGHFRDMEAPEGMDPQIARQPDMVEEVLAEEGAGSLLFVREPAEFNRLQRLAIEGNRHDIPVLFGFDVIHGFRTILPVPIALAASWEPETVARGQAVAAREARAVGIHWTFAPMVDIARDPRWGRIIEGAGEDPFLGAAMAAAQVRGFQGEGIGTPDTVVAGPKHIGAYGAALGGPRLRRGERRGLRALEHLFPALQVGARCRRRQCDDRLHGAQRGAGHRQSVALRRGAAGDVGLRRLGRLRRQRGPQPDDPRVCQGPHRGGCLRPERRLRHGDGDLRPAYAHLPEAVASGQVDEATLDASVRRVLEAKLRLGLFEAPFVDEDRAAEVLADPAHREVAREAAERSAVLLKNDGDLLPLDPAVLDSVAVIGPLAYSKRDILGPWCFEFDLDETVTVLDGLRAKLGEGTSVEYAPGIRPAQRTFPSMFDMFGGNAPEDPEGFDDEAELQRAVDLAARSDVAVVVVGERQNMIGEAASRSSLELPGRQLELLQAVAATGTPVVLLVMNGRPLDLRWAAEHVPAILDIWYPGTRGGEAVVNLFVGDAIPGGKLPFTWPRTVGQVPMIYSHTRSHEPENQGKRYWDEESTPLFPFGHGLSYGRFDYRNLTLDRDRIAPGELLTVSVEVVNIGGRTGDGVAQLYIHQRHGRAARPVRELKGFRRLTLAPEAVERVEFTLGPEELCYWHPLERDWVIDAATFDLWVGGDSTADVGTTLEVTGDQGDSL